MFGSAGDENLVHARQALAFEGKSAYNNECDLEP